MTKIFDNIRNSTVTGNVEVELEIHPARSNEKSVKYVNKVGRQIRNISEKNKINFFLNGKKKKK